ncbi:hypothetical protein McanMca71_007372 [Microsporum canis]
MATLDRPPHPTPAPKKYHPSAEVAYAGPALVQNSLFVKSWNILRPIVQAILGETDWALVYVIRRMEEHCDRDPITITITVAEDSTKEWTYGPVGKQYSLEYHDLHIFRDKIGQLLDSRSIAKLSSIYAAATSGTPIKS